MAYIILALLYKEAIELRKYGKESTACIAVYNAIRSIIHFRCKERKVHGHWTECLRRIPEGVVHLKFKVFTRCKLQGANKVLHNTGLHEELHIGATSLACALGILNRATSGQYACSYQQKGDGLSSHNLFAVARNFQRCRA